MGGSGGGGYFRESPPERIKEALRREEQETENQIFDTQVSTEIGNLLSDYNERDTEAVHRALQQVRSALEDEVEDTSITPVFGGSVRKHTYVNGISDVDSLLVLKAGESGTSVSPSEVLDFIERVLCERFPKKDIRRSNMSIEVEWGGTTLELLPAVRKSDRLLIPSAFGTKWSKINPEKFFAKLSKTNDQNGGKVIPTIKIVKGINDSFSEPQRLTGYHIESLAIEAFKEYSGPRNTKAMVEHFFEVSREAVLSPIKDRTGQSVHVDGYAGPKNSAIRKLMSQNLDRIGRRIKNANATQSLDKWNRILNQEQD